MAAGDLRSAIMNNRRVLVVGAGCFGLSSAYHLLQRGFVDVTLIDRSATLPAPDAASSDINKIVRTSYADVFYARLAQEAIQLWKDGNMWGNTFHESGVLAVDTAGATYGSEAYRNEIGLGASLKWLDNEDALRGVFPPGVRIGPLSRFNGYLNCEGGWADASQGIQFLMSQVIALGANIHTNKCATELIRKDEKTIGVRCTDDSEYYADLVILSTGSWTPSSFPELNLQEQCLATGQSIAMIQLTEDEAAIYRACPVVLDFSSGFYVFPPNQHNVMKFAIHAAGYTHTPTGGNQISTPRTVSSHAEDGLRIPKSAVEALRRGLMQVYPDLARKPFCGTRLCWYADTPDADWMIGFHPSDPSLMLATGGSGHAYKFLPVIGRLVVDALQGTLDSALVTKFAVGRKHKHVDSSRLCVKPEELDVTELCSPTDLQARNENV